MADLAQRLLDVASEAAHLIGQAPDWQPAVCCPRCGWIAPRQTDSPIDGSRAPSHCPECRLHTGDTVRPVHGHMAWMPEVLRG